MLNLDNEDLSKSSLFVTLIGTTSDNPDIGDDKIVFNLTVQTQDMQWDDRYHN